MINPFRTKRILIISPNGCWDIEIPFLRKVKIVFKKENVNLIGKHYEGVIVDEVVYG